MGTGDQLGGGDEEGGGCGSFLGDFVAAFPDCYDEAHGSVVLLRIDGTAVLEVRFDYRLFLQV